MVAEGPELCGPELLDPCQEAVAVRTAGGDEALCLRGWIYLRLKRIDLSQDMSRSLALSLGCLARKGAGGCDSQDAAGEQLAHE